MINLFFITNGTSKIISEHLAKKHPAEKNYFLGLRSEPKIKYGKTINIENLKSSKLSLNISFRSPKITYTSLIEANREFEKLKKEITKKVGNNKIILYTPHFLISKVNCISKMNICKEINLIEEGSLSYKKESELYPKRKKVRQKLESYLKNIILYGSFGSSDAKARKKINKVYSLNEKCFPWSNKKIVFDKSEIFSVNKKVQKKFENSFLFLVGCFPFLGWIPQKDFIMELKNVLRKLSRTGNKTFVKYHPNYKKEYESLEKVRDEMHKMSKDYENIEITNTSCESIVASCEKVKVIALKSSVAKYAKMNGIKTYSWYSMMDKNTVDDKQKIKFKKFESRYGKIEELLR